MAIRIATLTPALAKVAARVDTDGSGQVTLKELERAKATPELFSPGEKRALTRLQKVLDAQRLARANGRRPAAPDGAGSMVDVRSGRVAVDASGDLKRLNDTQRTVLADVQGKAAERSRGARAALVERAKAAGYTEAQLDQVLDYIHKDAPVTVNIHPDKSLRQATHAYGATTTLTYAVCVDREKSTLVDALMVDGHYKNQFETGITSGSSSAYPGGSRDRWERTIFEEGYHTHDLIPAERPKYGAMNAARQPQGPAQQYGTCYFVLKPRARTRATFTPKNSSGCVADQVGTAEHFQHVLGQLQENYFREVFKAALDPDHQGTNSSWTYIEAQIHGPIEFDRDIARLVVAQKFKGTPYEAKLRVFAEKNRIPLAWHDGQNITEDKGAPA